MKAFFLIIFLVLGFNNVFAHKDILISEDFGNVKVLFKTGFYYEEMNKSLIIGKYAELLSKKLNYTHRITLFFIHNYTNNNEVYYKFASDDKNNSLNKDDIYLEMKDEEFDIFKVLWLLEHSIKNVNNFNSLDEEQILNKIDPNSESINEILKTKFYRPLLIENLTLPDNKISYYFQNNKFHIFRVENKAEKVLFEVDNIFQIAMIDEDSFLIFITKESFYYITSNRLKSPSQKMIIKNFNEQVLPYGISNVSFNITSITFSKFRNRKDERVMLFYHENENLIQDISEFIKE